jgi:asparagine N-glycosylation enzyme membrane subunit Stt3
MLKMPLLENRWFAVAALLAVMLAGFYIRFDSLSHWQENKQRYFFDKQQIPLMLTVDAYFYLDAAKAVQDGTYEEFDQRRRVPAGYHRSPTPPLLSVITAWLSSFFHVSLEWIAILLPAVLGSLLAIPAYLLASGLMRRAGPGPLTPDAGAVGSSRAAGLVTALYALLSPFLVGRNAIGWFDTDMLNISFSVFFAWLAMKLADSRSKAELTLFMIGYGVGLLFFLWWWDQSTVPVFALAGLPLLIALLFIGKRSPQNLLVPAAALALLLIVVGTWKGFSVLNPLHYWQGLKSTMGYITSDTSTSVFRAAGAAVSEQSSAPLRILVTNTCGGWLPFFLALAGLSYLAWITRKYFLFLTAILFIAVLALKGQRFLIFWAPLFGLGIGTLVYILWERTAKISIRSLIVAVLIVAAGWAPLQLVLHDNNKIPRRSPVLFDAMKIIADHAQKDAVVWATWGHGHPLVYYTGKGVIGDGIFHSALIQYVINFPLATDNQQLAANWISFYVAHGEQGLRQANTLFADNANDWAKGLPALQQLLAAGSIGARFLLQEQYGLTDKQIEQNLTFLFPGSTRPVYLFIDYLLLRQAWYILGRWDVVSRSGPKYFTFLPIARLQNGKNGSLSGLCSQGPVEINPAAGRVSYGKNTFRVGEVRSHDGRRSRVNRIPANKSQLVLDIMYPAGTAVLADTNTADTLITKLFFEMKADTHYFMPLYMRQPYYTIWMVRGEKYRH